MNLIEALELIPESTVFCMFYRMINLLLNCIAVASSHSGALAVLQVDSTRASHPKEIYVCI